MEENFIRLLIKIFKKNYGGVSGKDIEEFYGIGTDVLMDIWIKHRNGKETYDASKGDFDAYVYRAISLAVIDEFKRQNRDKRSNKIEIIDEQGNKKKISIRDVRLDAPISDDSSCKDEFGLLSKELIDEVQEWNKDVRYYQTIQSNFGVGIFYPNVYDEFKTIDYERYVK